jgi:hypothetical protein
LADFLTRNVPNVSLDRVAAGVLSKDVRALLQDDIDHPVSTERAEEAMKMRSKLAQQYEQLFRANDISAIVYPTVPVLAPKIRSQGDTPEDTIEVNGKQLSEFRTVGRNTHLSGPSLPGFPHSVFRWAYRLKVRLAMTADCWVLAYPWKPRWAVCQLPHCVQHTLRKF